MKKTYEYHKPSAEGLRKIGRLREAFSDLHEDLENTCPQSRELSLALTHLETAAMWATKAVTHNDPESEMAT